MITIQISTNIIKASTYTDLLNTFLQSNDTQFIKMQNAAQEILENKFENHLEEDEAKYIWNQILDYYPKVEIKGIDYKPQKLPPFLDVAEKMGIKVKWKPIHKNAYGYYRPWDKSITLCSQDYIVYFHELAHAVHDTIEPLKNVDTNKAEIVAELSAAVLTEMLGISGYEQQAYDYIKTYTKGKKDKNVIISITNVMNTVQKVVEKITSIAEKEQKTAA